MDTSRARTSALVLATIVALVPIGGLQAAGPACLPAIADGWVRLPPVDMPMLGGFGALRNDCKQPVSITAASSSAFADVSIHETRIEGGVSRMRPVPALELDAGGAATLAPGGLHLMLMQPLGPLAAGDFVEVTFTLDDGRTVSGSFEVRAPGN